MIQDIPTTPMEMVEQKQRDLERAYMLGLLHGINSQSMAQVESEIMSFEDYGWGLEDNGGMDRC